MKGTCINKIVKGKFAKFSPVFAMTTKKCLMYLQKNCVNRLPIFVLICRFKGDFMQKTSCQNVSKCGSVPEIPKNYGKSVKNTIALKKG
jgi:hypothetical protein